MSEPAEVFPVSQFIQEEMDARGWTVDDLLNRMPGNREHNALWLDLIFATPEFGLEVQKVSHMGDDSALAHAFGTSKGYWENLDNAWLKYINRTIT